MYPSAFLALALSSLPLLVSAAAADTAVADNMLTFFGPTALNSQAAYTFLDCVNATGAEYGLFVEANSGGALVVVPMDQPRRIDFDTTDAALAQCIEASNNVLFLSAESTVTTSASQKGAVAVEGVTFDWLVAQGALGKQAMGTRPATSSLSKRTTLATQTYSAYLDSSGKGCVNHDHHTYEEKECHGVRQQYKSVRFENTHGGSLHMEIWPHHDCKKGDSKSFVVSGKVVGECYNRDTYSWDGHY
ncbi:hypothetical protein SBRCBS47491_000896 [Sporothrix bragantina]|uniref:Uncharacterized protein n=1 Tax=Sporothrix bragantina TaxID=671064 RepID=A0ABP0AU53_9PEZI